MIKKMTPSKIHVDLVGRCVTVEGEALLPGHGSPDFVIYPDSIVGWDVPHDSDDFTAEDKRLVIEELKKDLNERGITYLIE
jgi:hypothetical protein